MYRIMTFYARLSSCMSTCAGCPKYREISPAKGQSSVPYWEGARLKANFNFRPGLLSVSNSIKCHAIWHFAAPLPLESKRSHFPNAAELSGTYGTYALLFCAFVPFWATGLPPIWPLELCPGTALADTICWALAMATGPSPIFQSRLSYYGATFLRRI